MVFLLFFTRDADCLPLPAVTLSKILNWNIFNIFKKGETTWETPVYEEVAAKYNSPAVTIHSQPSENNISRVFGFGTTAIDTYSDEDDEEEWMKMTKTPFASTSSTHQQNDEDDEDENWMKMTKKPFASTSSSHQQEQQPPPPVRWHHTN